MNTTCVPIMKCFINKTIIILLNYKVLYLNHHNFTPLHVSLKWKKRLPKPVTSMYHWFREIMENEATTIFFVGNTQPWLITEDQKGLIQAKKIASSSFVALSQGMTRHTSMFSSLFFYLYPCGKTPKMKGVHAFFDQPRVWLWWQVRKGVSHGFLGRLYPRMIPWEMACAWYIAFLLSDTESGVPFLRSTPSSQDLQWALMAFVLDNQPRWVSIGGHIGKPPFSTSSENGGHCVYS
jgi:hypothetical protein